MTHVVANRPPINPATDLWLKGYPSAAHGVDPWVDTLAVDGWKLVPRNLPEKLQRSNIWYLDYRDAVADYRRGISEYLSKKQAIERRPWWRRILSREPSIDRPRCFYLGSFAEVYCVDPKLAITGLQVFLDPPPFAKTSSHGACQLVVVKTFAAIAQHRLPAIPDNVYATALHCLDVLERIGLDEEVAQKLKKAREAIAKGR